MPARCLPLAFWLVGCPSRDDTVVADTAESATPSADTASTPSTVDLDGTEGAVQDLLRELAEAFPGYADAAARLLDAYNGGTPEGVTLSEPGATRVGTVSVDHDLDGTYDEDLDVTLFSETQGGPVQLYASTGYYRFVSASRNFSVVLSADATGVDATNASVDLYDQGLSFHASEGVFRFVSAPPAGSSAGTLSYVAYTAEPNSLISGVITATADSPTRYILGVTYTRGEVRGAAPPASPQFFQPVACGASIEWILETYCSHGLAPANVLLPAAFVTFLLRRRRIRHGAPR